MTIKWQCAKQGCYIEMVLPDWIMLNGCFKDKNGDNTKVAGSDIDGVIHQNGRCLFLEKKFPNGYLTEPQVRMITTLVGQGNSYITIWCEYPSGIDISKMRVWGIAGYDSSTVITASLEDFRAAVCAWWNSVYQPGKV